MSLSCQCHSYQNVAPNTENPQNGGFLWLVGMGWHRECIQLLTVSSGCAEGVQGAMAISEDHPDISQTGRGQGQNTLEEARGCARAPPAPWHRVSHCHHHCCRAGQARASRWLLALPAPPGTARRCLPGTVPIGDGESFRGAEGTQSHARGDAGELPPQHVAPMSPASFTAPRVSAKGVSGSPPIPCIYSRVILGQSEGESWICPLSPHPNPKIWPILHLPIPFSIQEQPDHFQHQPSSWKMFSTINSHSLKS